MLELDTAIFFGSYPDPETIEIIPLTGSWAQGSVTWNSRPGVNTARTVVDCFPTRGRNPLLLDIADIVRGWHDGTIPNHGIEISAPSLEGDPGRGIFFTQCENSAPSSEARLIVTYVAGIFTDGFESGDTSAWRFTVP